MLRVFWAEIRRSLIVFVRYPAEAITLVIMFSAAFLALLYGVRTLVGPEFSMEGGRLATISVKYLVGVLALYAMTGMAWTIQNEAQAGTLEQLFLTPWGPVRMFLLRALSDLVIQLGVVAIVALIIELITRISLNFTAAALLPLLAVLAATYGLGYMLGGLALLLKRIQNLIQLSQFVLLFLVMIPVETWQQWRYLVYLLPLTGATEIVAQTVSNRQPVAWPELLLAALNGLVYFFLGVWFFRMSVNAAKKRGLLGGY
jgi:ABC-2 type transport system permease protein